MVNWLFLSFSQSSYCIFIYPSVSTLQTVDAVDTIKCGLRKPKFPIFAIKKKIIRKYLSNTECLLCNNFNFLVISVLLSEVNILSIFVQLYRQLYIYPFLCYHQQSVHRLFCIVSFLFCFCELCRWMILESQSKCQ